MLVSFLEALAPVSLLVFLGFLLAKRTRWLDSEGLGLLASNLALPALIFISITEMQSPASDLFYLMVVTALCIAIGAVLVTLSCLAKGVSPRFYVSTLVNPNTGNLGIPIAYALLGPEALAPAIIISTTVMLSHFTLGTAAMSGHYQWHKLFKNAPLLALLLGAMCVALPLNLPGPLTQGLKLLSGVAIPIMLLLLGRSIADIHFGDKQQLINLSLLSIFRPVSGFLIACVVVHFADLDATSTLVLMLQMSMPVAVMSYILTVKYNGPKQQIAALTLTTLPTSLIVLWFIYQFRFSLV